MQWGSAFSRYSRNVQDLEKEGVETYKAPVSHKLALARILFRAIGKNSLDAGQQKDFPYTSTVDQPLILGRKR